MNSSTANKPLISLPGLLCHLAFWFGPVFATPVFITLTNQEDVVLSPFSVAASLALICLLISAVGWKLTQWVGPRFEWWVNRLLLAGAFVLAIQGNIVHDLFYYGAFNGERVNFRGDEASFQFEKWAYLLALPLIFGLLTRIKKLSPWLAALPIASFLLLLLPAWLTATPTLEKTEAAVEIDPSAFEFSSIGNLIHLLPDGFQGDVVREVLQERPELAARFDGFTLFTDHLGLYQGTAPSLYTILTGKPFDLDAGYVSKSVSADIRESSYPADLAQAGYQVDYVPIAPWICIKQANTCYARPFNDMKARGLFRHHNEDSTYSWRLVADLTLFRLVPRWVKEKIYDQGNWFISDTTLDGSSPWPDPVIREWTENLTVIDDQPVYKWHHYIGTHIPPKWTGDCQRQRNLEHNRDNYKAQAQCVLNGIAGLLDRLREAGIYDQTAMVISGDHGHNIYPDDMLSVPRNRGLYLGLVGSARPALLVKQKNHNGPLQLSPLPTSLLDVAPTALALSGVDSAAQSVFDLDPGSVPERHFTPYSIPHLYSGKGIPHVRYQVGSPAHDGNQWRLANIVQNEEPPTQFAPVNFNTAEGFVVGAVLEKARPDKDSAWIKGREIGFLLNIPDPDAVNSVQISLHLTDWMPQQTISMRANNNPIGGAVKLQTGEVFWQEAVFTWEPGQVSSGSNFMTVNFDQVFTSPDNEKFKSSVLLNSIKTIKVVPAPVEAVEITGDTDVVDESRGGEAPTEAEQTVPVVPESDSKPEPEAEPLEATGAEK